MSSLNVPLIPAVYVAALSFTQSISFYPKKKGPGRVPTNERAVHDTPVGSREMTVVMPHFTSSRKDSFL